MTPSMANCVSSTNAADSALTICGFMAPGPPGIRVSSGKAGETLVTIWPAAEAVRWRSRMAAAWQARACLRTPKKRRAKARSRPAETPALLPALPVVARVPPSDRG